MAPITLNVNGEIREVDVDPATPLLFVLRNHLGLTGPKLGCGLEQCGACAVLVDGNVELCCAKAVSDFVGQEIITIEELARDAIGQIVQDAFIEEDAAQCGYCTSGIVVRSTALLKLNPTPSREETIAALNDHLCRCGSHARVLKAVKRASDRIT